MTPRDRFDALTPEEQEIVTTIAHAHGLEPWQVFDTDIAKSRVSARRDVMERIVTTHNRPLAYVAGLFGVTRQAAQIAMNPTAHREASRRARRKKAAGKRG